jgi:hypothetical protein
MSPKKGIIAGNIRFLTAKYACTFISIYIFMCGMMNRSRGNQEKEHGQQEAPVPL